MFGIHILVFQCQMIWCSRSCGCVFVISPLQVFDISESEKVGLALEW